MVLWFFYPVPLFCLKLATRVLALGNTRSYRNLRDVESFQRTPRATRLEPSRNSSGMPGGGGIGHVEVIKLYKKCLGMPILLQDVPKTPLELFLSLKISSLVVWRRRIQNLLRILPVVSSFKRQTTVRRALDFSSRGRMPLSRGRMPSRERGAV